MASILCSNCNKGIHYHGIPSGTEYVFISTNDWEAITHSAFNKNRKKYHQADGYPYLFRTDAISEDFPEAIITLWKCPHCGTFMFFNNNGMVIAEYTPCLEPSTNTIEKASLTIHSDSDTVIKPMGIAPGNYVVFDDYTWNKLTELSIPNNQISEKFQPPYRAEVKENLLILTNCMNKAPSQKYEEKILPFRKTAEKENSNQ